MYEAVRVAVCGADVAISIQQSSRSIDRSAAAAPAARSKRVICGFSVFNACFFALCTVYVRYVDDDARKNERGPARVARSRRTPLETAESRSVDEMRMHDES